MGLIKVMKGLAQLTKQARQLQDQQQVQSGYEPGMRGMMSQVFNLYLDLEVHVDGLAPYQIANQYLVPASAPLGPGVVVPVRVDPNDQTKIAIEWAKVAEGPTPGEVRPAGGVASAAGPAVPIAAAGDPIAALERLAKLRDAGVLTEAEFAQAKAAILGT